MTSAIWIIWKGPKVRRMSDGRYGGGRSSRERQRETERDRDRQRQRERESQQPPWEGESIICRKVFTTKQKRQLDVCAGKNLLSDTLPSAPRDKHLNRRTEGRKHVVEREAGAAQDTLASQASTPFQVSQRNRVQLSYMTR